MENIYQNSKQSITAERVASDMIRVESTDPACRWACTHYVKADSVIVGESFRKYKPLPKAALIAARKLLVA